MGLVAVADGMGGHRAGEVASATALEALRAAITSGRPLRESIEDANEAVFAKSLTDTEPPRHGHDAHRRHARPPGNTLLVGHVGDSRAYLLHDGELAPGHRRPQPGRGARARRTPHRRRGRGAPAALDHHPRARRGRDGRGRRVPGRARPRRPPAALLRRPHRHGAGRGRSRPRCDARTIPTRAAAAARRRREPRRRRGQHHRGRGRGDRRGAATRGRAERHRADRGRRGRRGARTGTG